MSKKLPQELRIVKYRNAEVIKSRHPFRYESFATPELSKLRKKYRLEKVITGKKTEFDKILALRNWVHSQWDHGWSFKEQKPVLPLCSTLRILEEAQKGIEFHCAYYSTVFIQCALSLGFQARRLSIYKDISHIPIAELHRQTNIGHYLAEIWSNDFQKWILIDTDMNAHYEEKNIPLNAWEVREAWVTGRWKEVRLIQGKPPPAYVTKPAKYTPEQHKLFKVFTKYKAMDYYYHLGIEMRNDWFSSDEESLRLIWADPHSPPVLIEHPDHPNTAVHDVIWTQNINNLYWTLNQVHIHLSCAGKDKSKSSPTLEVKLETVTPNFDKYLVKIDGSAWRKRPGDLKWKLKEGRNTIYAKSVNKFRIEGPSNSITISFN